MPIRCPFYDLALAIVRIEEHRTELEHAKDLAVFTHTPLPEDRRPWRIDLDGDGDDDHDGQCEHQSNAAQNQVQRAFHQALVGVEHRLAQADQRQPAKVVDRGPKHCQREIVRHDANVHRHGLQVSDQLIQAIVGSLRKGHNQLVDVMLLDDSTRIVQRSQHRQSVVLPAGIVVQVAHQGESCPGIFSDRGCNAVAQLARSDNEHPLLRKTTAIEDAIQCPGDHTP